MAQQSLLSASDPRELVAADMEFHRAIADASGNQVVKLLLESLGELRKTSHAEGDRGRSSIRTLEEHVEILTAILGRQGEAAGRAMEEHLLRSSIELGFPVKDISK